MHFPTVALIGRYQDAGLATPLRALAHALTQAGRQVLVDADTARNTGLTEYPVATYEQIGQDASLAVVMGGDGTVLGAARHLAPFGVPLVGINHGHLGFITDIPVQDAHDALARVLEGNFQIEERMLLEGSVWRGDQQMYAASALNDVVLNRAGRGGMIEVRVELDGAFMYTQRADGLIIATPTGSTAYSLSAGGPIVHPTLSAVIITPICPHLLTNRPIVVPESSVVEVRLVSGDGNVSVTLDGQVGVDFSQHHRLTVRKSAHKILLVEPPDRDHFEILRTKLNWGR